MKKVSPRSSDSWGGKPQKRMAATYEKIVRQNLNALFRNPAEDLADRMQAHQRGTRFEFYAFGELCVIQPDQLTLNDKLQTGVLGILISLYALHAKPKKCVLEPFKAFKDFRDSMPYIGAFAAHTQHILNAHVDRIKKHRVRIMAKLNGINAPVELGGDFSFVVFPLPKIALCYIFYQSDEDFPASATCLFSNNAHLFSPVDAQADIGEYTSKTILNLLD